MFCYCFFWILFLLTFFLSHSDKTTQVVFLSLYMNSIFNTIADILGLGLSYIYQFTPYNYLCSIFSRFLTSSRLINKHVIDISLCQHLIWHSFTFSCILRNYNIIFSVIKMVILPLFSITSQRICQSCESRLGFAQFTDILVTISYSVTSLQGKTILTSTHKS